MGLDRGQVRVSEGLGLSFWVGFRFQDVGQVRVSGRARDLVSR